MITAQLTHDISALIDEGALQEAENQLSAIAQADQANADWLLLKGKLQLKLGDLDQACQTLEAALQAEPDDYTLCFDVAFEADLHGEDNVAIELYEWLVREPPLHVNALINLAVLYEDQGLYSEAEICLIKVLDHFPNHPRAQLFLKDVQSSKTMYYDEDFERSREKRNAVLDIPISDFELSVRSRNCLKKMDIASLGDLLRTTEAELLSYKNFGETSLSEIKAMLRQKGLRLGQALEEDMGAGTQSPSSAIPVPADVDPAILNKPVSELELSVRSRKCLQRLGVTTLGELAAKTEGELLAAKNFGQTSLNEIKLRLSECGLGLRKIDV